MVFTFRLIELLVLFIGVPIVLIFTEDIFPLIPTLLILLGVILVILRATGWQYRELWQWGTWRSWRNMLLVFLSFALFWTVLVWLWQPERLFSFPRERFDIWIMVMALYPLVSALPQEIMYRTFFWYRYAWMFGGRHWLLIVVSGVLFMWGHLMFMNWFALLVTFAGGLTFAWRYQVTRSLPLVAAEHALYGNLFFTLGLGQFLFSGAV